MSAENFLGLKNFEFLKKFFFNFLKYFRPKKFLALMKLGLGLGPDPKPKPNTQVFFGSNVCRDYVLSRGSARTGRFP